ncbi:MAG: 2-phospho-L-lactate guanylyltransferase [Anaerolineaceae bacterium]
MTTWAIVPAKPFQTGKSRLGGILSDGDRLQLNTYLLRHTLSILRKVNAIDKILVISKDEQVLMIARQEGTDVLLETGKGGLNRALYQANNTLNKSEDRIVVIPTDLPLMTPDDIEQLLAMGSHPPVVVVVPDRCHNGTNALLVNPAGSIRYRYGQGSFNKHVEEARKRGINVIVPVLPDLTLDLDVPEDLDLLKSIGYIIPILSIKPVEEKVT